MTLIHNPAALKLGRKAVRHDPRTLRMGAYLKAAVLPDIPDAVDWGAAVGAGWPMMLNDQLGDCTCAAAGHLVQAWTANTSALQTPSDADILQMYERAGGYDPADPATDQGAVELDVLNFWRANPLSGHKMVAFVAVTPGKTDHVKEAIYLFGGLYAGVALPLSAQAQTVWDVTDGPTAEPGCWGGHAIAITGYDAEGLTCITWGARKRLTWAWWAKYADPQVGGEAYALLSPDWTALKAPTRGRFDYAALAADLSEL